MIFALGTPINTRFRPWTFDWALKPDALMISAIDFFNSPRLFQKIEKKGIHEFIGWDGQIICDSGAFSALNRKRKVHLDIERIKEIYRELNNQDPSIIKITLDFPDDKILPNYQELFPLEVQPVVPYNQLSVIDEISKHEGVPEWFFIGRLVPLMRRGGGHAERLFSALDKVTHYLQNYNFSEKTKIWALGVGAPSLLTELVSKVDGCDSTRWRITGSNMILLPKGGERGVGKLTKWRGTHHRLNEGVEKSIVIQILGEIDQKIGGLDQLDPLLKPNCQPKILNQSDKDLPKISILLNKLRDEKDYLSVYDLELLFRTSGTLRLMFNYWSALSFRKNIILKNSNI